MARPERTDGLTVRAAVLGDAATMAAVQLRSALTGFAHIFPADAPKPTVADLEPIAHERLAAPAPQRCFLAELDGAAVGIVTVGPDADVEPNEPPIGHLAALYVDPRCWRAGVGRALHDRGVDHLRGCGFAQATLLVLERNTRARRWYERLGWDDTGYRWLPFPGLDLVECRYGRDL